MEKSNLTSKERKAIKRLETVMVRLGVNGGGLSKALGYAQPQSVYHILKGRNAVSKSFCKKLVAVYPFISLVYLLEGTGSLELQAKDIYAQHHLVAENPKTPITDVILYEITIMSRKMDALLARN